MSALMAWGSATFLNALWQTALVFCAAWMTARFLRSSGPQMLQRVWVAALLLEVVLPFCHLQPELWLARLRAIFLPAGSGVVSVHMTSTSTARAVQPWLPDWAQGALTLIFLLLIVFAFLRVMRNLWRTYALLRRAKPLQLSGEQRLTLTSYAGMLGVDLSHLSLAQLDGLHGPATLGLVHHTLLLPTHFVLQHDGNCSHEEQEEVATIFAHELEHIRRHDFAWNLLLELITMPLGWHPLLRLTHAQIDETRELAVDREAARLLADTGSYARSLVRIATRLAAHAELRPIKAMGIYDNNIFERRIMNLMQTTKKHSWIRRCVELAACMVLAMTTGYTAMALQAKVSPASEEKQKMSVSENGAVTLNQTEARSNLITKVAPVYPAEAKAEGVAGMVLIRAVIGKDGHILEAEAISGPELLRQPSIDAIRQWVYRPYILNGEPVAVNTQIQVVYTLGSKAPENAAAPEEKAEQTSKPRMIKDVNAVYPAEAREKKLHGVVTVKVKVDSTGKATVLGVEGPEIFWHSAKTAVEQYQFEPARQEGHPIEATIYLEVNYALY